MSERTSQGVEKNVLTLLLTTRIGNKIKGNRRASSLQHTKPNTPNTPVGVFP